MGRRGRAALAVAALASAKAHAPGHAHKALCPAGASTALSLADPGQRRDHIWPASVEERERGTAGGGLGAPNLRKAEAISTSWCGVSSGSHGFVGFTWRTASGGTQEGGMAKTSTEREERRQQAWQQAWQITSSGFRDRWMPTKNPKAGRWLCGDPYGAPRLGSWRRAAPCGGVARTGRHKARLQDVW